MLISSQQRSPPSLILPGWNADPEKMADLSETFDKLRRMNKYNTLVSGLPRPLLVDAKSGVPNVLVEVSDPSGQHDHQYYIWNQLTDYVSEVLSPKTAKKIVPLLLTNGKTKEGLVIRKLECVMMSWSNSRIITVRTSIISGTNSAGLRRRC